MNGKGTTRECSPVAGVEHETDGNIEGGGRLTIIAHFCLAAGVVGMKRLDGAMGLEREYEHGRHCWMLGDCYCGWHTSQANRGRLVGYSLLRGQDGSSPLQACLSFRPLGAGIADVRSLSSRMLRRSMPVEETRTLV